MSTDKESSAAGTDNHPPMLVESDYDSWKIRIHRLQHVKFPTHQLNTKFVNNLPSYWGKYVTNVKQNMDISTTNYVHIYTHLKAYEPHATRTLKKQEQSSSIIDPLAYMAQATPTTSLPPLSTSQPQPL
ncbi:hypothetical protein Tco_0955394 [Tanacetum coccineum]|uniref:Uncharacterized protein n=1 Tax=Tanacetum coccineum TaxID=301880 RepID=A0ABQ5E728_9ASTR